MEMIPLTVRVFGMTFKIHIEERPLANFIGNVTTDAMERMDEEKMNRKKDLIGFHTLPEPQPTERI